MWADADQQTIDQHPAIEDGWELINDQYEIIWCNGLQLPDTLVPEREDVLCEDDVSAVVLSSDDEHGELSSENDDDDAGDDYWMNRANHYRSCHLGLACYSVSTIIVMHSNIFTSCIN